MLEEAFEDSLSKALFKEAFTFPLWLCRSSDPARKNIFLYVDGPAILRVIRVRTPFGLKLFLTAFAIADDLARHHCR